MSVPVLTAGSRQTFGRINIKKFIGKEFGIAPDSFLLVSTSCDHGCSNVCGSEAMYGCLLPLGGLRSRCSLRPLPPYPASRFAALVYGGTFPLPESGGGHASQRQQATNIANSLFHGMKHIVL